MADDRISMSQGAGGEVMQELLNEVLIPGIRAKRSMEGSLSPDLMDDSASVEDSAFTIDGHTIWPLEFPGGDLGSLSVCGTVNDLAVVGAVPTALALSIVMEEGLKMDILKRIAGSVGTSAREAGTEVITGDTKVVERGGVRGMITSTAGLGRRHPMLERCLDLAQRSGRPPDLRWLRDDAGRPGDHIILTGSVGDHGISLLSFREDYGFDSDLISDVAPLNSMMSEAIETGGVASAKDLTRGGLSNGLNEWARKTGNMITVSQDRIPVIDEVSSACDMLGLDPLEIGNEGKAILAVADGREEEVLKAIRSSKYGKHAQLIGRIHEGRPRVVLETSIGGKRIMDPPHGDPVPRIC